MATPVIDSFTADKGVTAPVAPGTVVTVTLVAHSPSTRDVVVTGTASDPAGLASGPAVLTVHVVDPVTLAVSSPGVVLTPVAGKTGVYTFTT